jgi:hypothetical protein
VTSPRSALLLPHLASPLPFSPRTRRTRPRHGHGRHCRAVVLPPNCCRVLLPSQSNAPPCPPSLTPSSRALVAAKSVEVGPPSCSYADEPRAPVAGSPRTATGLIEPAISFTVAGRPSRAPSSAPLAAGKLRRRSRRGSFVGHRGQRAIVPLSVVHDHRPSCSGTRMDARPSARRRWPSPGRSRRRRRIAPPPLLRSTEEEENTLCTPSLSMTDGPNRTVGPAGQFK